MAFSTKGAIARRYRNADAFRPVPGVRSPHPGPLELGADASGCRWMPTARTTTSTCTSICPVSIPESIELTVQRNTLNVSAGRQLVLRNTVDVLASERPQGKVSRQLLLGENLDLDHLEANYDRGSAPRSRSPSPRRPSPARSKSAPHRRSQASNRDHWRRRFGIDIDRGGFRLDPPHGETPGGRRDEVPAAHARSQRRRTGRASTRRG